ncbi:hypothetical protein M2125_000362 [Polynucleobacter sphagniphilus]|nr:hypothetical protein [Polynucleobacter sphagniphilus]
MNENIIGIFVTLLGGITYLLWNIESSLSFIKNNSSSDNSYKLELELQDIKYSLKRIESQLSSIENYSSLNKIINKLEQIDTTIQKI